MKRLALIGVFFILSGMVLADAKSSMTASQLYSFLSSCVDRGGIVEMNKLDVQSYGNCMKSNWMKPIIAILS